MRQLRNLYWAKKNDVFGSTHVLLKKYEMTSKELESTLKEWLGENVYMRKMSENDSAKPPTPRYDGQYEICGLYGKYSLCQQVVLVRGSVVLLV